MPIVPISAVIAVRKVVVAARKRLIETPKNGERPEEAFRTIGRRAALAANCENLFRGSTTIEGRGSGRARQEGLRR